MNKMKTILWLVIAIVVVAGIWYYINIKQLEQKIIKIGYIGPLSGDSAIIGKENLNGVILAMKNLNSNTNNKKFELIIKDDQNDTKETITQYKQLVYAEGVRYILTVTYGGFITLAKQTEQDGVILIDSLDASEEFANLSKNSFAIGIYDESIGYTIADYLNKNNISKSGLISNLDDAFVLLVKNAFKNKYKGKIQEENYTFDTKDFRTILSKLSFNDYIILLGWEETGRIIKQAVELGLKKQFIGIDTFASENFRKNTNNNYDGLLFTFWQGSGKNKKYNELISNYRSLFGKDPENILFVATGYDAMKILGEVLNSCNDNLNCVRDKLRNSINKFEGATGLITIDKDGITRSIWEVIHKYQNGKIIAVD
jgi:branched-chain amino acid transport system substrate-binding protein